MCIEKKNTGFSRCFISALWMLLEFVTFDGLAFEPDSHFQVVHCRAFAMMLVMRRVAYRFHMHHGSTAHLEPRATWLETSVEILGTGPTRLPVAHVFEEGWHFGEPRLAGLIWREGNLVTNDVAVLQLQRKRTCIIHTHARTHAGTHTRTRTHAMNARKHACTLTLTQTEKRGRRRRGGGQAGDRPDRGRSRDGRRS